MATVEELHNRLEYKKKTEGGVDNLAVIMVYKRHYEPNPTAEIEAKFQSLAEQYSNDVKFYQVPISFLLHGSMQTPNIRDIRNLINFRKYSRKSRLSNAKAWLMEAKLMKSPRS